MRHAVVLFSGGQDSTTTLFWAKQEFDEVFALSFDYGQMHADELLAAQEIAGLAAVQHELLELDALARLGGSALLVGSTEELQGSGGLEDNGVVGGLPTSFVPGRNLTFLAVAGAYAVKKGAKDIVVGFGEADYSGYPDCRQGFLEAMTVALDAAMPSSCGPFTLHAPLMQRRKKDVVKIGRQLGEQCWLALGRSVTCYRGRRPGCGQCPSCQLRRRGFEEAGLEDPAEALIEDVPDILRSLPPEELAKVKPLSTEEVDEALRKGAEDRRREEEHRRTGCLPDIRFRGPKG